MRIKTSDEKRENKGHQGRLASLDSRRISGKMASWWILKSHGHFRIQRNTLEYS